MLHLMLLILVGLAIVFMVMFIIGGVVGLYQGIKKGKGDDNVL